MDTAACMLAGADDAAPRAAYTGVARWGAGSATVAGTPHRLAAPWAALVNGTAAHALDYDDILEISNAHVSAALVPALLALGQERAPTAPPAWTPSSWASRSWPGSAKRST